MRCARELVSTVASGIIAVSVLSQSAFSGNLVLTQQEVTRVLSHGPWPLHPTTDLSNRVSGKPEAIDLGRALFFSPRLSVNGQTSCASCHQPARNFTDGLARGEGFRTLDRNTLALQNLRYHRWFGWDGKSDNLWAQSIVPILHANEMALPSGTLVDVLSDPTFAPAYTALFGSPAQHSNEQNLVNVGKSLAAYQETLTTGRTDFDRFRDALKAQNWAAAARYPKSAQRGLALFIGRGNCSICHSGPLFSNGKFYDSGVPYFVEAGRVDKGRLGGIEALQASPFTLDGLYSDDAEKTGAWAVRQLAPQDLNLGTFRVPSLRNVAKTGPYMHNGSLRHLKDVARHYSNINMEHLHADVKNTLFPLQLTEGEINHLVAFLQTLSSEDAQ
jgi:cytochrome c peroxidase